jgi:glycosyltransferase involved in cell wall biosynthesis
MLIKDNISSVTPIVSICCLTFNHEKYIRQTLDGFLMQQTNFSYEIVIHDDASTDNTVNIIKEYDLKYPNVFKPIYQKENQKSTYKSGMNPRFNYPRSVGKYIALCEGDDYWTDPLKLQKQVDFLEANPEYVGCYNGCKHINDKDEVIKETRYENYNSPSAEQLLTAEGAMITHSVMFRNIIKSYPALFDGVPSGDTILYHLLGFHGHGKFLSDIKYSAYRIHGGGIWSGINDLQRMKNTLSTMSAIKENLSKHFGIKSDYIKKTNVATFNNINSYLYQNLHQKEFKIYFKLINYILKQNNFSKSFLLKEHFIDLFQRVFKKK